jgi:type VI secretion system protein ImpM
MGFGLFGKLPQKRDFVSANLPNAILNPFETWLQSCVSASRNEIGREWEQYYLVAPIWHFWLGPEVLGAGCAGALMPSVDQVGRYFPLSIIYVAEPNERLMPPLLAPMDEWFAQIDQRMLAVLSHEGEFEVSQVLAGLMPPVYDGAVGELTVMVPGMPVHEEYVPAPEPEPVPPPAAEPAPEPEPEPVAAAAEPEPEPEPVAAEDKPLVDAVAAALAAEPSPWDAPVEDKPAAAPAKPSAESWDDLPDLDAKDFGLSQVAASGIRDRPPTGTTIPPTEPQPVKAVEAAAKAEAAAPAAASKPVRAAPAQKLPPPQIMSELFKGGIDARIEPQRTFNEALGGLMALDYHLASNNRTYWWCPQSANGYASFFAKQGLPDPYYFSRMIRFNGGQR